jgi:leader peptidase (prepilin peptidase)/N-methyltransferase
MVELVACFALVGACAGSFVAAMAWRLPRSISAWGRSACVDCGHVLDVTDLVPVLSWLWSRGHCRYCGTAVSRRYPLVEMASTLFWALCALLFLNPVEAVTVALLGSCLLYLSLVDADWQYLPDGGVLLVAALGVVRLYGVVDPWLHVLGAVLIGGVALSVRFAVSRWLGRESLGLGDVKLMVAAGLWVGVGGLPGLLFLSGTFGITQHWLVRRAGEPVEGPELPFGPALSLATVTIVILGSAGNE